MAGLSDVLNFTSKKKKEIQTDNAGIDVLSKNEPMSIVNAFTSDSASISALDRFKNSPITQLGEDFLAQQISQNAGQIINNVQGLIEGALGVPLRKTIQEAQEAAFNSVSAAMTANNDLSLFFLQKVAEQAVLAIQEKREILLELKEAVRKLHNALKILEAGNPFFSVYLADLRSALVLIAAAEDKLTLVRNNLVATDIFSTIQFDSAKEDLSKADDLLTPKDNNPDTKFTDSGLLENVGIPSDPQQLTILLSIPQLSRDIVLGATGYFSATFKVNLLLKGFSTGLASLQDSKSQKLKDFTVKSFDTVIDKLGGLIERMADQINGSIASITEPVNTSFAPDAIQTSSSAIGWLLELRGIIEMVGFIPGSTFKSIQLSQAAVQSYEDAIAAIATKDDRSEGNAFLSATDGQEDTGQLETQLTLFAIKSLEAIVDAEVADEVVSLGRTVIARLDLSLTQDSEIEVILQDFIDTDLPFFDDLNRAGNGILGTLRNFGLDKAADSLISGDFSGFFNMNSKTATFVGAALVGIAALKECLDNTEDQEQLDQAQRVIERENTAKELLARRGATIGFEQQKVSNENKVRDFCNIENQAKEANSKCGLVDTLSPPNLVNSIGGFMGLAGAGGIGSLLGGGGTTDLLNKVGRGIV